jgi:hypothetical protein
MAYVPNMLWCNICCISILREAEYSRHLESAGHRQKEILHKSSTPQPQPQGNLFQENKVAANDVTHQHKQHRIHDDKEAFSKNDNMPYFNNELLPQFVENVRESKFNLYENQNEKKNECSIAKKSSYYRDFFYIQIALQKVTFSTYGKSWNVLVSLYLP